LTQDGALTNGKCHLARPRWLAHALSYHAELLPDIREVAEIMNVTIRTLFFLSAIAPAVVLSAAAQVYKFGGSYETYGWIAAGALACVFPFLVIRAAGVQTEILAFSAKKIESQDWLLVVFVVSYFIPLITKLEDLQVLALISAVSAVLLATLEAIPCHPMLHVFRYRFYKVEGANGMVYTLISRRKLLSAADIKSVRQLSPQLLLEG
jgi:hypothetical protein